MTACLAYRAPVSLPDGAEPFASYSPGDDPDVTLVERGGTYEHTFEVAGEYTYVCIPHADSGMMGTLLIVPVIMWIWHYVALTIFGSTRIGTIIDYAVIAAAFLAIGYLLRTGSEPTRGAEPAPDSTA
ncbi:hypothetical protein BRC93_11690 [Halobacteriales archaeon QS_5_70_15]|nr:MAG: hypothetical protein BRC93_11690 [Halobacteriales archaeon QS_5_70_15]